MSEQRTVIINGQEVQVTVIDPVEVDRTKQTFLASGVGHVEPVGYTSFHDGEDNTRQHNDGYRAVPPGIGE